MTTSPFTVNSTDLSRWKGQKRKRKLTKTIPQKLFPKTLVASNGCLLWMGATNDHYYGIVRFRRGEPLRKAHRLMWELVNGPLPEGLVLDHLCRVPPCVNPRHLEAVPERTNILRGVGPTAINAAKTHCKRGHPLSGENLDQFIPKGSTRARRVCKTCRQASSRKYKARIRAEKQHKQAPLRDMQLLTRRTVRHISRLSTAV